MSRGGLFRILSAQKIDCAIQHSIRFLTDLICVGSFDWGGFVMVNLADSLILQSQSQLDSHQAPSDETTANQRLADEITIHYFEMKSSGKSDYTLPAYKRDNTLFPGMDKIEIVEAEKSRCSSLFEGAKWIGGVCSAYKWAPQCMPKEIPPAALIEWKKKTAEQYIFFGSKSHAEMVKELKLRYVSTCIGSMILGWTASHAVDRMLFPRDQYLEGSLIGDATGIGLAIVVPGWRNKALLVTASHLIGKTLDHWQQPH